MSSFRTGFGLPARPSDGYRSRKNEDDMPRSAVTRFSNLRQLSEVGGAQSEGRKTLPGKSSTDKTTQLSSPRELMLVRSPERLASNVKMNSGNLKDSELPDSSNYSRRLGSGSFSGKRSCETTSRSTQAMHKKVKSSGFKEVRPSHKAYKSTNSLSSTKQAQSLSDQSIGIQCDSGNRPRGTMAGKLGERGSLAPPAMIYPELDRYREFRQPGKVTARQDGVALHGLATQYHPPSTPGSISLAAEGSQVSAVSASPSTKFSGSPGPNTYSRNTTPTSISSQSPILVAPNRLGLSLRGTRHHHVLSTRPPVTKRRAGSFSTEIDPNVVDPKGLASVRESLTSSSSNSTLKEADKIVLNEAPGKRRLSLPPRSPPPRGSSQKFGELRRHIDSLQANNLHSRQHGGSTLSRTLQKDTSLNAASTSRTVPPARPSRRDNPDMKAQLCSPTHVVQSNLRTTNQAMKERLNGLEAIVPQVSAVRRASTTQSASSDYESSKSHTGSNQRLVKSGQVANSIPKALKSAYRSGFPFFGKRKASAKVVPTSVAKTEKSKTNEKGTAARTSHEGYNRLGIIPRRSSSESMVPRNVNDPLSSPQSPQKADSFFSDRMNPVIISGGEIVENRNLSSELTRSETVHSTRSNISRPTTVAKTSTEAQAVSQQSSRSPRVASSKPLLQSFAPHPISQRSRPDESIRPSTLALRRSANRTRSSPNNSLCPLPPIDTTRQARTSPTTSLDTSIMSDRSSAEMKPETSSSLFDSLTRELQRKPRSPRRWNLLSRSSGRSSHAKNEPGLPVRAAVRSVERRPLAFYAILDDPEQGGTGPSNVLEVLREADVYAPASAAAHASDQFHLETDVGLRSSAENAPASNPPHQLPLNESLEEFSVSSANYGLGRETFEQPRRLVNVGRIPQVVKHCAEKHSSRSFSRPFRAGLEIQKKGESKLQDLDLDAMGSTLPLSSPPMLDSAGEYPRGALGSSTPHRTRALIRPPKTMPLDGEFLSIPPRKISDSTTCTSSSSSSSASHFVTATAVIPRPDDPPAEDEVWDEYDDLLGINATRENRVFGTFGTSNEFPSRLGSKPLKPFPGTELSSTPEALDHCKTSTGSKNRTNSTSHSADVTKCMPRSHQPELNITVLPSRLKTRSKRIHSENRADLLHGDRRSSSYSCQTACSDCSSCSSNDEQPHAFINLRVGSMTVSKWLTFGHVLFSEVRHEITRAKPLVGPSILVIDGLGNDDWSFYAAETYPEASVYNLSPRAPLPAELQISPSGMPLSPANHHQVQYKSPKSKFPFDTRSFDVVVYRFPTAAPEGHYRNILSESRRVLRVGGYIELSILDSDLNNLGNLGRRAIRRLKEDIRFKTPDTSFTSTPDLVVRLLGRIGFSDIKAAHVGLPVASSVARCGSQKLTSIHDTGKKRESRSLADMIGDNSPLADQNITKIISRVGRWWYTRCYELAAGTSPRDSMWNDRALLSECEQSGTSLKLMVCCARTPI